MLARWTHYAALPLRFVLGALFIGLAAQKLWGYFGGPGLTGTAQAMETAGFIPGTMWAWVAGLVELLGGIGLVAGVFTRWTALVLALESLVAVVSLAAGAPVNVPFRLATIAGLGAITLIGPQMYALDLCVPALGQWAAADQETHHQEARKAA
jgi:putative oxidoreductase